jgi:hypothetical protein
VSRLGADMAVEIFYRRVVPRVPRSMDGYQDRDETFDDPAEFKTEHGFDMGDWHIIMADEPETMECAEGDVLMYWHQAEYRVYDPATCGMIMWQRLFLNVTGSFPNFKYRINGEDSLDGGFKMELTDKPKESRPVFLH